MPFDFAKVWEAMFMPHKSLGANFVAAYNLSMKPIPRNLNALLNMVIMTACVISAGKTAQACATDLEVKSPIKKWHSYWLAHNKSQSGRKPSQATILPSAQLDPWGGTDSKKWQPEAIMANAASEVLNEAWAESNIKEVLVAIPLKMQFSSLRPYDDGQTNATFNFGQGWNSERPPLIAALQSYTDGSTKLKIRFHQSLKLPQPGVQIQFADGSSHHWDQTLKTKDGDFEVEWKSQNGPAWGDLFQNRVAFVKPDGWNDWFPLDFRNVVRSVNELLAQVPGTKQNLGKGNLLDPEKVSVQGKNDGSFPFQKMGDDSFGQDINGDRYFPVPGNGIHAQFPVGNGQMQTTAVGQGNTLVMIKAPAPFKLAYICFDARNPSEEAKFGVPSGGGWHEIGDPAETVFNTLENAPVVFGYANGQPAASTPSGGFSYGLTDVAVIRKLMPGSALITAAGTTTASEDASGRQNRGTHNTSAGRNYHWFIFDQPHEVCAIEWVHPSIPSPTNHWGMAQLN